MTKPKRGDVLALVGAQYGSEGKGAIAYHLARQFDIHVRSGGPNAGHTIHHQGREFKLQQIPCGWVNPHSVLYISRGALVSISQLAKELDQVSLLDPTVRGRLYIDAKAGILDSRHHHEENGVDGELHQRIGSTGEGVGAARLARVSRDPTLFYHAGDVESTLFKGVGVAVVHNTPAIIQTWIQRGRQVLLEGTQGTGLSLIHGPWPYVTSADTNAATMAADAGIPPYFVNRVMLVVRTQPIRVAGNSGPLEGETTWDEMSARLNRPVQEHTTVTKKPRRIGAWDDKLMEAAVILNAPQTVAITFLDYINPDDYGKTTFRELSVESKRFVHYIEQRFGVRAALLGTSPTTIIDRGYRI